MPVARVRSASGEVFWAAVSHDRATPLRSLDGGELWLVELLREESLAKAVDRRMTEASFDLAECTLLAPIDRQEVWAAGVTYKRSKTARMEESDAAASCYDRVYEAPRPEIFFKATPHRVSGPLAPLRIRSDATWNVPEPELALVISPDFRIAGYTIGNDMSSRDIEGENPLYLPQAKVYDQCCGLGPWIVPVEEIADPRTLGIRLRIERLGQTAFSGETSVSQMARELPDLAAWLCKENSFPDGTFLLTGTGVVPDSSFTLQTGDVVRIEIDGIGELSNRVVQATV